MKNQWKVTKAKTIRIYDRELSPKLPRQYANSHLKSREYKCELNLLKPNLADELSDLITVVRLASYDLFTDYKHNVSTKDI